MKFMIPFSNATYSKTGLLCLCILLKLLNIETVFAQETTLTLPAQSNDAAVFHKHFQMREFNGIQDIKSEQLAPFYHGVASGDCLTDRVIIWTRLTKDNSEPASLEWFVATDTSIRNIVQRGFASASIERDFTVKVDVSGLQPGTTYYYMFKYNGKNSLIGRTKTAPVNAASHLRFAFVSCSNYSSGYFNAYRKIAQRNDLDAVIHLGDYIYEYGNTTGTNSTQPLRPYEIDKEIVSLADYRARYSLHRLDPDLLRLHQQHPFLYVWDDHEAANNAYKDGADNHTVATEGDWQTRLAASKKACYEWLPIRENDDGSLYRKFQYGELAEIVMIDTRMDQRDPPVVNLGKNAPQSSIDSLLNPQRKMMSEKQFSWLTNSLQQSKAQWKIIGNQVLFTPIILDNFDTTLFVGNPLLQALTPILQNVLESGYNADSWGNFPTQRNALHSFISNNSLNNIVFLTGDIHTTHGMDIAFNPAEYNPQEKKGSIGVEFVTPSISSTNFDEIIGNIAFLRPFLSTLIQSGNNTMINNNPYMKDFDLINHGYSILDITPERCQTDVFHIDTVKIISNNEKNFSSLYVNNNDRFLQKASTIAQGKNIQDIPAPLLPLESTTVSVQESPFHISTVFPNPAKDRLYCTLHIHSPEIITLSIHSLDGKTIKSLYSYSAEKGIDIISMAVNDIPNGAYSLHISHGTTVTTYPFIIQK
jgi:alkaline phosphatase D